MTCLVLVQRPLLSSLLLELLFHYRKNNMYSMPCTANVVQYLFLLTFQYLKYIKSPSYSCPKYLFRFFRTSCLSLSLSLIVPTEIMFRLTYKTHCFQPSGVLSKFLPPLPTLGCQNAGNGERGNGEREIIIKKMGTISTLNPSPFTQR